VIRAIAVSLLASIIMLIRGGLVRRWLRDGTFKGAALRDGESYSNAHLLGGVLLLACALALLIAALVQVIV